MVTMLHEYLAGNGDTIVSAYTACLWTNIHLSLSGGGGGLM